MSRLLFGGLVCGFVAKLAACGAELGGIAHPTAHSAPANYGKYDKSADFVMELVEQGKTIEEFDKEQEAREHLPREPVRAVIVGGGYCGSKVAALCDSLCDVTLVDEKNFFELSVDLPPILAKKWEDGVSDGLVKQLISLHRFYLKRTNILTGTVTDVDPKTVTLSDGRVIPYDILILAHGRDKPFPFRTRQRTITGRVEELKQFNEMLHECKRVAIVGAGPMGCMLASELAGRNPEMDVTLFHKHPFPAAHLTAEISCHVEDHLLKFKNLHMHLNTQVTSIQPLESRLVKIGSWWNPFARTTTLVPSTYKLTANILGGTQRPPKRSMVYRVMVGEKQHEDVDRAVIGKDEFEGYDFVFDCTGYTPKPLANSRMLKNHIDLDGKYRVSTQMMLVGLPNVFAVGSCNSFPWIHTMFDADMQSRIMFKILFGIGLQKGKTFSSVDGIKPTTFSAPHLIIPLYNHDHIGNTHYGSTVSGISASAEFIQDRSYLMSEFKKPKFFKKFETARYRDNFDIYLERQVTDVCDFEY